MSLVINRPDLFAVGASVAAYPSSPGSQPPSSGPPPGTATQTVTVDSDGNSTFTSLVEGQMYTLYRAASGDIPAAYLRVWPTATQAELTLTGNLDFGADVNLYRSAADVLKTDDSLTVGGTTLDVLTGQIIARKNSTTVFLSDFVGGGDTQPAFSVTGGGKLQWGAGGSSAVDTNLYRSAANVLKTDDTLDVVGDIQSAGERRAPYRMQAGSVNVALSSASNGYTSVTFDTSRFTQTPLVVCSVASAPGGSAKFVARSTSVSSTGFDCYVYTGDSTAQTATVAVSWIAVQMTSAAGAG